MDECKDVALVHKLTMENRERIQMSGVTDVKCFDEDTVSLVTSAGDITISGTQLHIAVLQLETGDLHLTGKVNVIEYHDRINARGKMRRLFR